MSLKLVTQSVWNNPGNQGKRLRKLLEAVGWQIQKHVFGTTRLLTLPNGVQFRAYPDCVISSSLIYSDWPEYYALRFARSVLGPNDVVIDVGAHVGHISLLLADVVGRDNIFAFEPVPVSFDRLTENWELNEWEKENLFQVALGAESGETWFKGVDRPNPMASMSDEGDVKVPVRPLGAFRNQWRDRSVGLLKIDVEGYEARIFRGGNVLLRTDRPELIMFESLEDTLDRDIRAFLEERDYMVFQLDEQGQPDLHHTSNQNLFAVPMERRKELLFPDDSMQWT